MKEKRERWKIKMIMRNKTRTNKQKQKLCENIDIVLEVTIM